MSKIKKELKKLASSLCVLFVLSSILAAGVISLGLWLENIVPTYEIAAVNVARAEEEQPIRLWALNKAYEAGLNPDTFDCVIRNESGWNVNAYNVNKNGSVDIGLVMWNSIHIKSGFITLECASTPRCAVLKMINKVKKDGGYNAWYGYASCK